MRKRTISEAMNKDLFDKLSKAINLKDSNVYLLTKEDAQKLFKILNDEVFDSKLPPTAIVFSESSLKNQREGNSIAEFIVAESKKSKSIFEKTKDPSDLEFIHFIRYIDLKQPFRFESVIIVLLHEMIHEYDFFYSDLNNEPKTYVSNLIRYFKKRKDQEIHGKDFEKLMNKVKVKTGINVAKEFFFDKALPKKVQENLDKISESDTFITNGCKNSLSLKLAKLFRAVYVDDGSNIVEIDKNGLVTLRIR